MRSTVLIVDDSAPFRGYLKEWLATQPEFQVVGEAADGLAGVQKAEELRPDLVLLDIGMPELNGIDAARQISKLSPASRIIFVTEYKSTLFAQAALSVGAHGYLLKSHAASELRAALSAVQEGRQFVSGHLDP